MSVIDYTVIGVAPDISKQTFLAALASVQSPAILAGSRVYDYCVTRHVAPGFLLALFRHESGMGKAGTATITHSWGNTRLPVHGGVTPVRLTTAGEARSGTFPVFRDWIDGGIATVARLVDYAPYQGKTTVGQIVPTWAPASDGNDPLAYVRAVLTQMTAWRAQDRGGTVAPTITQKLTPGNFWSGRNGQTPQAVVIHVSEGSKVSMADWFANPKAEASAHYSANKDGTVWRYVNEEDTAWANGKTNKANMADPLIASWLNAGINPNRTTISIETEGFHYEDLTPSQLSSLCWLVADLHRRYGWPTDGSRIMGHYEFDAVDRPNCPSLNAAEWAALRAAVAGQPAPNPPPPAHPVGYLEQGQPDTFNWNGAGIITSRSVRYYNPSEQAYYERSWKNDTGFSPWEKVA